MIIPVTFIFFRKFAASLFGSLGVENTMYYIVNKLIGYGCEFH